MLTSHPYPCFMVPSLAVREPIGDVQGWCGSFRHGHREEVCAAVHVVQGLLFLGLPRLLFGGLTLCREWDKKVNVRWGWGFPSWSCFATYSFDSIHQSSLKIVSWRNGLIEYLNFELTIALIFPQVSCILELLTFRLCQLIKMFLCSYWGLIFFFFPFNW